MRGRLPTPWEDRWIPEPNTGCFLWVGQLTKKGYGLYGYAATRGKRIRTHAHRRAYELVHGPISSEQCVCHRCDTPACVNPGHLFLGTPQDNTDDMMAKGRYSLRFGEAAPNVRLSDADVAEMRRLFAAGMRRRELAQTFDVTPGHVGDIVRGKERVPR